MIKYGLEIYAAVAEMERQMISRRTKAALAAAKARGVKLGGRREKQVDEAMARAEKLRPAFAILKDLSARRAAEELNESGVYPAPNGGKWHAAQVIRVRQRLAVAHG